MALEIKEYISLARRTSFFIGGPARYFCETNNTEQLKEALGFASLNNVPVFLLGAGSNILVSDDGLNGLVIHLTNTGIETKISGKKIFVTVQAGHNWDKVVEYAVGHGWWGIENLSHIPGNAGAFAVQNVGAYGQEASQVISAVEVLDTTDLKVKMLNNGDCGFQYRSSVFNKAQAGRYIILSVTLKLDSTPTPDLRYGDLAEVFQNRHRESILLAEIRQAIIRIRNKKFPFPDRPEHGSAGSFFRGAIIEASQWENMKQKINTYFGQAALKQLIEMESRLKVPQGFKTPTAFLIELCGFKSLRLGGAQINPAQPAVILNTGTATAEDVVKLYQKVRQGVLDKSGVALSHEPEFVGF